MGFGRFRNPERVESPPMRRWSRTAEVKLALAQPTLPSVGFEPSLSFCFLASFKRLNSNTGKEHSLDLTGFSDPGLIGDDGNSVEFANESEESGNSRQFDAEGAEGW